MSTILIRLGLTLVVAWLMLSGLFKAQLLILGVMSVLLVCWLSVRMRVLTHRGQPVFIRFIEVIKYWAWLVLEIFKSNVAVTRILLDPALPIKPMLRTVSATPDTEMGRVIYANSITLTPGTTTINFTRGGDILVHALHESSLDELDEDVMAAHVRQVEVKLKAQALSAGVGGYSEDEKSGEESSHAQQAAVGGKQQQKT